MRPCKFLERYVDYVPRPFGGGDVPMRTCECVNPNATEEDKDRCNARLGKKCRHYKPAPDEGPED